MRESSIAVFYPHHTSVVTFNTVNLLNGKTSLIQQNSQVPRWCKSDSSLQFHHCAMGTQESQLFLHTLASPVGPVEVSKASNCWKECRALVPSGTLSSLSGKVQAFACAAIGCSSQPGIIKSGSQRPLRLWFSPAFSKSLGLEPDPEMAKCLLLLLLAVLSSQLGLLQGRLPCSPATPLAPSM